jgi:AcrR family transcriptional regulator
MVSQEKPTGRLNQKLRTRAELLRAARDIIANGGQPSVAEVADHAGISRATAYRYFSTPDELVREAVLDGVATAIEVPPAEPGATLADIQMRLDRLVSDVFQMEVDNEAAFRALLASLVADPAKNRRTGRRLGWLKEALAPLEDRLSQKDMERLVHALSLVMGIESLIVMRDVCGLGPKESEKVLHWAAQALFTAALDEARATSS